MDLNFSPVLLMHIKQLHSPNEKWAKIINWANRSRRK